MPWCRSLPRRGIGWTTVLAILGQRIIPGLLDRVLARRAWESQLTDKVPPTTRDNLAAPLDGDRGARGRFDDEAYDRSWQLWLRLYVGGGALGLGAVAAFGAWGLRRLKRSG